MSPANPVSASLEPRTDRSGYRHSQQCWDIGAGPGHDACICRCHETMSARDIVLDDPDWHAAACAYDAGPNECDCILPDRLSAIEEQAATEARRELLAKVAGLRRGTDSYASPDDIAYREGWDEGVEAAAALIEGER